MTPEQRNQLIKDYCYAAVRDLSVNELCEFVVEMMIEDDDDDDEEEEEVTVTVSKPAPPWAPKGFKNQR